MLDSIQSLALCQSIRRMTTPAYFAHDGPGPFNHYGTQLYLFYPVESLVGLRALTLFAMRPVASNAQLKSPGSSFSHVTRDLEELALHSFDLSAIISFAGDHGLPRLRTLALCMCSLSVDSVRSILRSTDVALKQLIIVYDVEFAATQSLGRRKLLRLFWPRTATIRAYGDARLPPSLGVPMGLLSSPPRIRQIEITLL
ncbi:hypothetical protein EXIGLDRAFT_759052 [Exidia glandulosa HHB12029]|uniref:Uncharacterized protein n=1 Tax=Exidia glandulosa HHB12029 TaxID=1314781 RepID=A0A165Q6R4_EXIGL|nr:hypothetical protein EXIGLDRAFT_759052 [Exidia glandulosa HHB12029]